MLRRRTMVCSEQPRTEAPEHDMNHREVLVGLRVVPTDSYSFLGIMSRC